MNALKLSVVIIGLALAAGCGDKNENDPINETGQGALYPASIEAKSLVAGPWCKIEMRGDKKYYEGRQFYQYNGEIIATAFEIDAQGRRVRQVQVPEFSGLTWYLDGDQLTHQMGSAKITFTVSFGVKDGGRHMTLKYIVKDDPATAENEAAQSTYEEFYGCP